MNASNANPYLFTPVTPRVVHVVGTCPQDMTATVMEQDGTVRTGVPVRCLSPVPASRPLW